MGFVGEEAQKRPAMLRDGLLGISVGKTMGAAFGPQTTAPKQVTHQGRQPHGQGSQKSMRRALRRLDDPPAWAERAPRAAKASRAAAVVTSVMRLAGLNAIVIKGSSAPIKKLAAEAAAA